MAIPQCSGCGALHCQARESSGFPGSTICGTISRWCVDMSQHIESTLLKTSAACSTRAPNSSLEPTRTRPARGPAANARLGQRKIRDHQHPDSGGESERSSTPTCRRSRTDVPRSQTQCACDPHKILLGRRAPSDTEPVVQEPVRRVSGRRAVSTAVLFEPLAGQRCPKAVRLRKL